MSTADGISDTSPYNVGDGRLNVERAALGTVQATGSRFFGLLTWPNTDVDPITRSVTYTNSGKTEAKLKLTLVMRDASGATAPKGAFTLPAMVTVPAHGSRTIKITATPNKVSAGTRYAGAVVATRGGATAARTGLAMDKEAEKYNLTLTATGRDGKPAQTWIAIHASADGFTDPYFVDGERTLRLPAGTYSAMTFMEVHDAADEQGIALVGNPEVKLDQDRVVELDATQAVPVTATVGKANAEATYRQMEYYVSAGGGYTEALAMPVVVDNMYAQPTAQVTEGTFDFSARWRLRTPLMRVVAGQEALDVIQLYGSPWLDGKASQGAVYVGAGSEADYTGVDATGKVAVITFASTTDLYTAAQTAKAHGAVFLLVVNDADGELAWYASGPNGETAPVPVATISGLQGAGLIQRLGHGDLTITTSGGMDTPWTYDLVDAHEGSIPADLSYQPDASELAKITTKYYGRKPQLGGEFRYAFRPQDPYGMGQAQYINFPATRTEYVSTQPGTTWYQGVQTIDGNWDLRGDKETYTAGQNLVEKWFTPVVYPRLGPGYWGPVRQYDSMQLNLPSYGDAGRNHTGSMGDSDGTSSQVIDIYQGDTLIKHSEGWQATYVGGLSPDKLLYRATSDISRSAADWTTSTRLHSEYTFWSEHDDGIVAGACCRSSRSASTCTPTCAATPRPEPRTPSASPPGSCPTSSTVVTSPAASCRCRTTEARPGRRCTSPGAWATGRPPSPTPTTPRSGCRSRPPHGTTRGTAPARRSSGRTACADRPLIRGGRPSFAGRVGPLTQLRRQVTARSSWARRSWSLRAGCPAWSARGTATVSSDASGAVGAVSLLVWRTRLLRAADFFAATLVSTFAFTSVAFSDTFSVASLAASLAVAAAVLAAGRCPRGGRRGRAVRAGTRAT